MTDDWYRHFTAWYDLDYWPGNSFTMLSPDFRGKYAGAWAEMRTPTIWFPQGISFVSFIGYLSYDRPLDGQIWLLNASDQPLQQLNGGGAHWGNGSGGGTLVAYPARYANSIAVGACSDLGMRSYYSCYGPELYCVAPSHGGWNTIVTTDTRGAAGANDGAYTDGNYRVEFGGTSAATPLSAGIAALVLSKNANLTVSQLKDSLRLGCEQIGSVPYTGNPPRHNEYGYGRGSTPITRSTTRRPIQWLPRFCQSRRKLGGPSK